MLKLTFVYKYYRQFPEFLISPKQNGNILYCVRFNESLNCIKMGENVPKAPVIIKFPHTHPDSHILCLWMWIIMIRFEKIFFPKIFSVREMVGATCCEKIEANKKEAKTYHHQCIHDWEWERVCVCVIGWREWEQKREWL